MRMKNKFVSEFEINSSPALLFPYISTPGGLSEWFADDVVITSNKKWKFVIDGEEMVGKLASKKDDEYVKIVYDGDDEDPEYTKIAFEVNEMTGKVYLVVTDYTSFYDDQQEHYDTWENLVDSLCDIVGA